ncbi:MAG: hypothetical protein S4CHLAM6_16150 [Chlamydiae bacterium]|nr:hypothetical protein [Chlamydiota bacterium]
MQNIHLQISQWGLLFGLLVLSSTLFLYWRYRKNNNSPSILYSDTDAIESLEKSWRIQIISMPTWCKKIAFILFILALCDPVLQIPIQKGNSNLAEENSTAPSSQKGMENTHIPTEGLAIYFILDQSGSMREEIDFSIQGLRSKRVTRIDALKFFTSQFISGNKELGLKGRQDDLVGLVAFARIPKIITPLTLDHEEVKRQLHTFAPVSNPIEEGTAIGYAIYKTAHTIAATEHFSRELQGEDKPAYDIKSTVMVLVTDGLQNPSSEDLDHPLRRIRVEEAAEFAKEKGIKLYIINIQPAIDFPNLRAERDSQKQSAELTGGKFFLASDTQSLHRIYRVIDGLERTKHYGTNKYQVTVEESVSAVDKGQHTEIFLYTYLTVAAMLLLLIAILLETTLLKRVP